MVRRNAEANPPEAAEQTAQGAENTPQKPAYATAQPNNAKNAEVEQNGKPNAPTEGKPHNSAEPSTNEGNATAVYNGF